MNGKKALFDSNIIIYLSKREIDLSYIDQFDELFISIITYMEILGYSFANVEEEKFIRKLLSIFHIVFINQTIADLTIEIRKTRRIKLPDAVILATAVAENIQLVSRDVDDFSNIDIKVLNPFE
ncbi:MAG: type II toxin-antitoxin system VapC family toxin [Desulfobacteraceae bacterium]|nr:type II toxin-antitoxin system VapC family toxin [Desulfobacteraceae bacterium]